jgi:hypothetical protein
MIGRPKRAWTCFWFQRESAGNLALARILVALNALWILASRNYAGMSEVPDVFWRPELAAIRWRYLIVPGHGDMERVLQGLAALALIGALVGIAPRVCCAVAALLLYHLAPLEAAIWTAAPEGRGMTLAPTALLILAAAPSGDAFALWPRARTGPKERRASRYGWALLLVQLLVCEIYLFSAIGKLERTGFTWGSAERMRLWLFWFNQDTQSVVFGTLGPWLAQYAWLCGIIGAATVVLEWTMPLALFWRPSRVVLVPVALAFHVGVLLSMNIHVPEAWLILVFVDWTGLSRRFRRIPEITQPA